MRARADNFSSVELSSGRFTNEGDGFPRKFPYLLSEFLRKELPNITPNKRSEYLLNFIKKEFLYGPSVNEKGRKIHILHVRSKIPGEHDARHIKVEETEAKELLKIGSDNLPNINPQDKKQKRNNIYLCLGIDPWKKINQEWDKKFSQLAGNLLKADRNSTEDELFVRAIIHEYCERKNKTLDTGEERARRIFNWLYSGLQSKLTLGIDATDRQINDYAHYIATICRSCPNEEAMRAFARSKGVELDTKQKISRLIDRRFWRKIIYKEVRRRREYLYMKFLPQKLKWCSDFGLTDSLETNTRNQEWLANHQAVSEAGDVLNFPSLQEIAKRNQAKMFRTAEYIAKKAADNGANHAVAFTITLPSRFHPSTTFSGSRLPNPKWDESNPRDGKNFFDKQWEAFTKQCKRLNVHNDYIMATEPHEDETPHWHGVIWTNKPDELKRLMVQYFYEKAEPDGGTAEVRVKVNTLESSGAALAYASKTLSYISKHQGADKTDKRFKEEAERSQAWARAWGIRRLRKSGVGVTLYEYLRRLDTEAMPDGEARAIIEAAKKGNMYEALKPGRFKFNYVEAKNIYDEDVRRIDGIKDLSGGKIIRKTTYTIKGKTYKAPTEAPTETKFQELQKRISGNVGVKRLHQEKEEDYKYQTIIIDYFQPLSDEDYLIPAGFPEPDHPLSNNINKDTS